MQNRKLSEYNQFIIDKITYPEDKNQNVYLHFKNLDGSDLPDYKQKFTKSQWKKASKYLNRTLIDFVGYDYSIKPECIDMLPVKII